MGRLDTSWPCNIPIQRGCQFKDRGEDEKKFVTLRCVKANDVKYGAPPFRGNYLANMYHGLAVQLRDLSHNN
jgi:hypothetical protein